MAGFEVIVRPVVFPVIRPPSPRVLAPENDPAQGIAVLGGSGVGAIVTTYSETASWTKSRTTETQRTVDVQRVYQKEEDGTVNKENFVDVEATREMRMQDGNGVETRYYYQAPPEADNIEIIETKKTIVNEEVPPVSGGGAAP